MNCSAQIHAAKLAMARAAWARGVAPYYDESAVIDMLVDLRHYARQAGIDFARCEHMAVGIFNVEIGSAP
ncbi:hypothetical protein PZ895_14365 [Mesorhizobium sp. YIM 152430]|uniref:hypothetical protein n=1 Tax=Mesorhizobium sp. YIM 152430 TaxID=3031761 RepID=UPI0023D98B1C|nr:hypothetical protein [Mesorhizobium sp. YIM 152430]MDF1600943.1 hypothetical protein [Mesorhizobium sp. YIM 152430]